MSEKEVRAAASLSTTMGQSLSHLSSPPPHDETRWPAEHAVDTLTTSLTYYLRNFHFTYSIVLPPIFILHSRQHCHASHSLPALPTSLYCSSLCRYTTYNFTTVPIKPLHRVTERHATPYTTLPHHTPYHHATHTSQHHLHHIATRHATRRRDSPEEGLSEYRVQYTQAGQLLTSSGGTRGLASDSGFSGYLLPPTLCAAVVVDF